MKKIIFPTFNRVHESRQKLLLEELAKSFQIHITTYSDKKMKMEDIAVDIALKFRGAIEVIKPDLALIRGDRHECLVPATLCAYSGIPIAHIEGFDLSGVIDNRVRFAISHLSDYHFVTNEESYKRAKDMGFKNVWNYGSLDVEYASMVEGRKEGKYIVALWHNTPTETEKPLLEALESFKDYDIVGIRGNHDYGIESTYKEEYEPDEFIRLLKGASCLVGNSSCGLKECSILGTPTINIGNRQANRLRTKNVLDVKCRKEDIIDGIQRQLRHGRYTFDQTYYKEGTSKRITEKIINLLSRSKDLSLQK